MRAVSCRVASPNLERILEAIHVDPHAGWGQGVVTAAHEGIEGSAGVCLVVRDGDRTYTYAAPEASADDPRSVFTMRRTRQVAAGLELVLLVSFEHPFEASPYERSLFRRLALHLENAVRLQHRPQHTCARVVGGPLQWLPGKLAREPHDVWARLEQGRLTFAPIGGGFALQEVYGSDRALTDDERAVVRSCVNGRSSKTISLELHLCETSVSRALLTATSKLGLQNTADLLRIAPSLVNQYSPAAVTQTKLTGAERTILDLVRQGFSNGAIAAARSSSTRTVANQMRGLLRKTGCDSRRALAALRIVDAGDYFELAKPA